MSHARAPRIVISVAAAAAIVSCAALAVLAAPESIPPPTRPPYELRDGIPVLDSLPKRVPVVDAHGRQVAAVPRRCLFAEPADLPADCSALPRARAGELSIGP